MNFDLSGLNPALTSTKPLIGNVYTARGGKPTRFWVVIAVKGDSTYVLGLDVDGEICSATSYLTSVVGKMPLIGYCKNVEDLIFEIERIA